MEGEKKMDGCDGSDGLHPNASGSPVASREKSASPSQGNAAQASEKSSSDGFYEKLCKLNESSGLSLVFNFRETIFDLHLFYKEVTKRGGFHQVSKDGKWGEVASALNFKSSVSMVQTQLQNLYENLFQQFEQMYHYRTPITAAPGISSGSEDSSSCLKGKRKRCDGSAPLSTVPSGIKTSEQKPHLQTSLKDKEMKKDPNAPLRSRSPYQIFLRVECQRLKKIHGESSGAQKFRDMAIEAWKYLSKSDRQPYIEASKKDKERFNRELAAYKDLKTKQNTKRISSSSKPTILDFSTPSRTDGAYYVTLQPDAGDFFVPDESVRLSVMQAMKNEQPNDSMFQINWDESNEYHDLDISS
ncbi:unnamed protein product [Ilex paraguariensis]|uniref:Uncharacterized protein n=1 Tax=Ilex paraguariensis TaxID=185542 RepID=A0ABC8TFT7_9AQUA